LSFILPANQFLLLLQKRFAPFFCAQFLGAFNDNLFKTALVTIITYDAASWTDINVGLLNNLIAGLFILPFLLVSATAGQIADKFEKSQLVRMVKILEISIMLIAAIGWMTHSLWILIFSIVAMGLHSTLFGPIKHAYLPQHLAQHELVGGNGMVQMGTFVGILTGQLSGAVLVTLQPNGIQLIMLSTLLVAVLGWLVSRAIPVTPAADTSVIIGRNPFVEMGRNLRFAAKNREVFTAMLANSWFWFFGAMLLAQFPVFARDILHGEPSVFVVLLSAFSLGIGAGSLLCEKLSGRTLQLGLVSAGAIGLTLFGLDLDLAASTYKSTVTVDAWQFLLQDAGWRVTLDCALLGASGGIYVVPLFALIQTKADRPYLSRIIGGMNILNALFMVVAALLAMLLLQAGLSVPELFLVTALMNAALLVLLFIKQPIYFSALLNWLKPQ
jgi:MFS family permease